MLKIISVRGKKNLMAVFSKYARISGQQDTGRPAAVKAFVKYISCLPLDDSTALLLREASKTNLDNDISDEYVPTNITIRVDVDEETWEKSMSVFRYAFSLKNNPQMPYFLRVAGTAYIRDLEEQNLVCSQKNTEERRRYISFEEFQKLDLGAKLYEIYKLLIR